jgi:hypothetical protein
LIGDVMLLVELRQRAREELLLFVAEMGISRGGELRRSRSREKSGNPPDAQERSCRKDAASTENQSPSLFGRP